MDKANGNPFVNVNYVNANDIWFDFGGAAYILAFRESGGLWYKNVQNSSAWTELSNSPDLIKTNWLGYCVTSMYEQEIYDEENDDLSW